MMFLLTLVMILGAVWSQELPLGGGVWRGTLLQQTSEGKTEVQAWPTLLHGKAWDLENFTSGQFLQHWRIVRRLGPVPGVAVFLGCPQR